MPRKQSLTSLERAVLEKIADLSANPERNIIPFMRDRLREFVTAARLISEGRYGKCLECENDIPLARLKAKPEAIRCVRCQALHERVPSPVHARSAS